MSLNSTAFVNARVVLPDRVAGDCCVVCEDGRISSVGPHARVSEVIDARGAWLVPGFIDLHIHGSGEWLIDDGPAALAGLSRLLPSYGVTGFVAAACARPKREDADFVAGLVQAQTDGAEALGLLFEGPYISLAGAVPQESLRDADAERLSRLISAAAPLMPIFAVSPEFAGITEFLARMTASGAPAFITHTRADVAQTMAAIAAGAKHATHFYDVFYSPEESDLGVRPCGAVEAILADPEVSVDFIFDGEHADPAAVRMALRCKGPDKVCLITDANRGAGLPPGRYSFGGYSVEYAYPGGPARYTADHPQVPGALAGSGLTMDQAVRNAVRLLDIDLPDAVRMGSLSPARVLGIDHRKGMIAPGYDADLVLLDTDLAPLASWVAGRCVYARPGGKSPGGSPSIHKESL